MRIQTLFSNFDKLRSYQKEGVDFLLNQKSALLADGMGLGKTVQTISAFSILHAKAEVERIIIICPASLKYNWEKEINFWSDLTCKRIEGSVKSREYHYQLPYHILICSYEQVRMDIEFISNNLDFDLVILDEAQRIKNYSSKNAASCRKIPRKRSWALTGTPIENSIDDIYSIFLFLKRGVLSKYDTVPSIKDKISIYFLRRIKENVLKELPPIIKKDVMLELNTEQRLEYDDLLQKSKKNVNGIRNQGTTGLFAILTKLKQLCNFASGADSSVKLDSLQVTLENTNANQEKVIVFSQYVSSLRKIQSGIPYKSELFHGGLNQKQRNKLVDDFEQAVGPKILLISLMAGGVGLNLNSATTVIMFDLWWNPALEQQAIERAHRFGKKEPLYVIRYLCADTIEEKIVEILNKKALLFEEAIEQAEGADTSVLTKTELLSILDL